jgi:transcription termination factor Rho
MSAGRPRSAPGPAAGSPAFAVCAAGYPAIDINRSGTRREEMLLEPDEYRKTCVLRRVLCEMNPPDAMELLINRLSKTKSNSEFLMSLKS